MDAQEGVAADTTTNHMGRTGYCNPSWQSGEVDTMMVIRLSVRQWTGPDGLSQRRNSAFTDDAFTTKKILPGNKPRMSSLRCVPASRRRCGSSKGKTNFCELHLNGTW